MLLSPAGSTRNAISLGARGRVEEEERQKRVKVNKERKETGGGHGRRTRRVINHPKWRITQGADISKAERTSETTGAFQIHSRKT